MTPDSRLKLKSLLTQDESYRQYVYTDTTGHLTIGIGRNLTTRGVSLSESLYLLDEDIQYFGTKLDQLFAWFSDLCEARQIVLINICFNVGLQGLMGFKRMLDALEKQDYECAATEILDSKVGTIQAHERYNRLANIMRIGEL